MLSQPAKLNVVCVDQYSDIGGAQRVLLDLLPSFHQRGWSVKAVLPGTGGLTSALESLDCQTYSYRSSAYTKVNKPASEFVKYAAECSRLARVVAGVVRKQAIDLIYVNGPRALPAVAWVARRYSIPLVFHCHNRLHQAAAVRLAGQSLRFARAHVVACCHFALQPLVPYLERSRLSVLYNGIAPPACSSLSAKRYPICRIGVIGRIEEEKGQLEFVRAARILIRQFEGLEFSIIGAPLFSDATYMEKVKAAATDLPVHFTGWSNDGGKMFSDLDLVVVPSSPLDATPRVILEAQAMQTPVVAFAVGGIPEIIRDGQTGFLVHEHTSAALAKTIASVLCASREELAQVREKASEVCRETYCLTNYRRQLGDFLQNARMAA